MIARLAPAFLLACPACGYESFHRGIPADPAGPDPGEFEPDGWLEPGEDAAWLAPPERVACPGCRREFETEGP